MDQERFDHLARGLALGISRRGMVRNLAGAAVGGILVAVGVGEAGARKKKRGGGKSKGRSQVRAQAEDGKVTICHHDQEEDTWHPISISANAVAQHKDNHGDFEYDVESGECCTDADCGENGSCTITVDEQGSGSGSCLVVCEPPYPGSGCGCLPRFDGGGGECVVGNITGFCSAGDPPCPEGSVCVTSPCNGFVPTCTPVCPSLDCSCATSTPPATCTADDIAACGTSVARARSAGGASGRSLLP